MNKPPKTVDEILDELEAVRMRKAEIEATYRGKGFWESRPEHGITDSAFHRRKLGDYKDGYFGRKAAKGEGND